ncbi:hypothetical protein IFR04_012888 [Cadophora malorum]|uniref:Uncharacterized protein n=1 Tax=Cadophora malorum TaxID=108018 RepID=A0A8H7T7M6_9HELO|nr:hypothetical protein IFR04_012888 [Cadophora malorum]
MTCLEETKETILEVEYLDLSTVARRVYTSYAFMQTGKTAKSANLGAIVVHILTHLAADD